MAVDIRLTANVQQILPNQSTLVQSFLASDTNQKLYLIDQRFGFALCGEAAIHNIPIAGFIHTFVEENISTRF